MRLGIDFGTTNSAAAVYDGETLTPVTVGDSKILPSLMYIDREYNSILGTAAGLEYARRETGRPVRWKSRHVGIVEVVVAGKGGAPITYQQDVFVNYDDAANGRLIQSIKTALRNERYSGTQIFERYYTLDALIALVLHYLKACAETQLGRTFDAVLIGRPVKFHDNPRISFRAEEIIYKAALSVGFRDISFQQEPIGAMYLYHTATQDRVNALVFDFGGGTLDLTVAQVGGKTKPNILSTRGLLVGGDDLDRRIFESLLPYFGEDPANGQELPFDIVDALKNWQTMPELSRPNYFEVFDGLRRTHRYPRKIDALQTLVSKNVGYSLFKEAERVKRTLTHEPVTELNFVYDTIAIHETITRQKFEAWIRPELREVEAGIQQVIADAGLTPNDIDVVLRTGGSSLVPAFVEMLTGIFGADKLHEMDPLISVVGGLGILAHQDGGTCGQYRDKYLKPDAIQDLQVNADTPYDIVTAACGIKCYTDLDTTIRKLPVELSGSLMLIPSHRNRESREAEFIRFTVSQPTRVYVAYSSAALERPHWLRDFLPEEMTIELQDEWWGMKELQIASKVFQPGTVILGGNHADGYRGRVDIHYLVFIEGAISVEFIVQAS